MDLPEWGVSVGRGGAVEEFHVEVFEGAAVGCEGAEPDAGVDEGGGEGGGVERVGEGNFVRGEDFAAGLLDEGCGFFPGGEIDLVDGGFFLEAAEGAFVDEFSFAKDSDAVAHELDLGEEVGVEEDGHAALFAELEDEVAEPFDAFGVEAVGGFV